MYYDSMRINNSVSAELCSGADMNDIHKIIRDQIKEPLWDNWYIKDQIGSGASSVVYRIEARRENRVDVSALKIEPIFADESVYVDEERRRDYLEKKHAEAENETTIMYKLRSSPNIVLYEDETIKPLIHEGRQIGYYMLIRMEYLTCLQKLMKERRFDCSEKNVMKLASDIGSGIKAAHDLGVIHRDIKPGNFFVSDSGIYKLGDFNISKKSVSARSFAGTEGYIAPEIYYARYGTDGYTKQADIYSFGIALYCLMNDYQFPFGDVCLPEEAIERRMNGEVIPPPKNASPGFARVILKACAFNTSDRYHSMSDLLNDLKNVGKLPASATNATVFAGTAAAVNNGANVYGSPAAGYPAPSNTPVQQPAQNQYAQSRPAQNIGYNTVYGQPPAQHYRKPAPPPAEKESSGTAAKILIALSILLIITIFGTIIFLMVRDNDDGGSSDKDSSSSSRPAAVTTVPAATEELTTQTTTTASTTTAVTTIRDTTIVLNQNSFDLEVGDTASVIIEQYPEGSDAEDEIWRSTDPSVATVNEFGFVTAVGSGKCYIIVSMSDNPAAEARADINVKEKVTIPSFESSGDDGESNIVNGGYACSDGDKIYYSDTEKLYSVKNGRSTVIGNYGAHYMNFIGNDIYFSNGTADNCICAVKRDGSDFRIIRSAYCYELTYYDGWLYFSEVDNNTNYICRMKPDGSGYTRLRQVKAWYMSVYAGNIYYVNYDNNYSLDVMAVDGSGNRTLVSDQTSDLCISGGRIYFSSDRDKRWLYSMNTNGSDLILIREEYTKHTNIAGNSLYCTDADNHLVIIDPDNNTGKIYADIGYISFPVINGSTLFTRGQNGETNIFSLNANN